MCNDNCRHWSRSKRNSLVRALFKYSTIRYFMFKSLLSLEKQYIHPEGTCSSVACHETGVPTKELTVLLSVSSAAFSSSMHFKFLCWSFCSAGLHSTRCTCKDSVNFLNFEAPYKYLNFLFNHNDVSYAAFWMSSWKFKQKRQNI